MAPLWHMMPHACGLAALRQWALPQKCHIQIPWWAHMLRCNSCFNLLRRTARYEGEAPLRLHINPLLVLPSGFLNNCRTRIRSTSDEGFIIRSNTQYNLCTCRPTVDYQLASVKSFIDHGTSLHEVGTCCCELRDACGLRLADTRLFARINMYHVTARKRVVIIEWANRA